MPVRHRIPSIFTLSMVDVLCCALGCVILLWLLNLREAKEHEDDAAVHQQQTSQLLAKATADRDQARGLLQAARAERADVYALVMELADEQTALQKKLAAQTA